MVRVCIDGRTMNSVTESIHVHLPSCEEVMQQLPQTLRHGRPANSADRARYCNVCDFEMGFHGMRYKPGLSRELTGFSTHRGNFQWRTCSMGSQSSPAVYVAMVNDCLSRYGICAGDRKDPAKRGPEADELQRIFSSKTEEYGDWEYKDDEISELGSKIEEVYQ